MKVLVTGGNGMLAYALRRELEKDPSFEIKAVDKDDCDITDADSVNKLFEEFKPKIVFNCAAYTAVDKAEEEFELACAINGAGVGNLAEACSAAGAVLVHYSTDYVFNGEKQAYDEKDLRDPLNKYGISKAQGEEAIEKAMSGGKYYIVRTAWLYGPNGNNFVDTMLGLAKTRDELNVVNDQHGSPTFTFDLARASMNLAVVNAEPGIYHFTNSGSCTWYEFASKIFELARVDITVNPVSSDEFPRPAKRPEYSILNNNKGPVLCSWDKALKNYLTLIKK